MFLFIATFVWGGLGFTLRAMFSDGEEILGLPREPKSQIISKSPVKKS
jgi:hypothetical protein